MRIIEATDTAGENKLQCSLQVWQWILLYYQTAAELKYNIVEKYDFNTNFMLTFLPSSILLLFSNIFGLLINFYLYNVMLYFIFMLFFFM